MAFPGNSKYVSGKGSSFNVNCHHSLSMGLKPWRSIAARKIIRLRNCSSVMEVMYLLGQELTLDEVKHYIEVPLRGELTRE